MEQQPIKVFFSYSREDKKLRDKLDDHLSLVKDQGVTTWHDCQIVAGSEWEEEIKSHIRTADIILLLISSDFIASRYCWKTELPNILQRHEAGEAYVIPVLLRPIANWENSPFAKLQICPTGGRPVIKWEHLDEALAEVVESIEERIDRLSEKRQQQIQAFETWLTTIDLPLNSTALSELPQWKKQTGLTEVAMTTRIEGARRDRQQKERIAAAQLQSNLARMKAHSELEGNASLTLEIYKLGTQDEMRDERKKIAKCSVVGEPASSTESTESGKVLMVLGATGAGKSTLINGMINYAMGVKWEDNFRFKLISDEGSGDQSNSQTKWITAYTVHPMAGSRLPYKLTMIDTPGFGDSGGLERDNVIVDQIREFFSRRDGIQHLDGIGFVAQASLARLTPTQKYIFDSILSIFGKDIEQNIFLMLTFADGQKPPIMDAISVAKVPYSKAFKFNNSVLFAPKESSLEEEDGEDNDGSIFDQMFWKMGTQSLKTFFTKLETADSVSLQLTKEVLEERKKFEAIVNGLLPRIQEAQLKLNELLREETVLTKYRDQIEANRNFTWIARCLKQRKVDLPTGRYSINCLTCNRTCHDDCVFSNWEDIYLRPSIIGSRTYAVCSVCNCHRTEHVKTPYRFEIYEEVATKTYDDVKNRYERMSEKL
jgi:energy-coupling factor transporter ATP-binding protein EcfA2